MALIVGTLCFAHPTELLLLALFLFFLFLRSQHGAATLLGSAPAGEIFLDFFGVLLVEHEAVVVEQFFARLDVASGFDEDAGATADFNQIGFAVGVASVIDPARGIAVDLAIDHELVVEGEVESVIGVAGVVRVAAQGFGPVDDFALVFDDAFALFERLQGVDAFAVNTGLAHGNFAARGFAGKVGGDLDFSHTETCSKNDAQPG